MSFVGLIIEDIRFRQQILRSDNASASLFKTLLADGISATVFYRLMQSCRKQRWLIPLAYLLHKLNKWINHCVIGMGAEFEGGLALLHPVGIVINSAVTGGSQIALESGVVIGSVRGDSPKLANRIYVGAGAKIIGGISVADDVKIGANAVLTKNAKVGETLVGIPARAIER